MIKIRKKNTNSEEKIITWGKIQELFLDSDDIVFVSQEAETRATRAVAYHFCYHIGLTNLTFLNETFLTFIGETFKKGNQNELFKTIDTTLSSRFLTEPITSEKEAIDKALDGELLFHVQGMNVIYSVKMAKHPERTPTDPNTEVSVIGARDGFIEEISVNVALIRKRLKTNSLHYKQFVIGERTKTKVGLLYVDDIINQDIKIEIIDRLKNVNIDGLFSTSQLHELIGKKPLQLFPTLDYTGRPDFVVDTLLRGRFVILIDGTPMATIGPANITFLFKSSEDNEYLSIYNSFARTLRIFGLLLAIFLPGFWIALTTYHQDQIPLLLLSTLVEARRNVPFPSPIEAFIMLTFFELFREAGLRMPFAIGQTITVVGGLIIGDAAIRAGLTSPSMVVMLAITLVATFTFTNQSFTGSLTVLRYVVLLMSSFLGLFGFFASAFFILIHLASIRILSVPYLTPLVPKAKGDFVHNFLRMPWKLLKNRPSMLKTTDKTRQGDHNDEK